MEETRLAFTEISALKSLETGQPVSAAFTAASNFALSAPGIFATRSRWLLVTEKPSPTFSSEIVAVVSSFSATMPAPPSCAESAIVKQPACAAARSSSGLVPTPFSKRVLKEYCVFFSVPLSVDMLPLPDFRSPCQTAEALRCIRLSPSRVSWRPVSSGCRLDSGACGRVIRGRRLILPLVEDEKRPKGDAGKASRVVPSEGISQVGDGEDREHRKGEDLLNGLELRAGEFVGAETVGGNLESILEQGDAPAGHHRFPQRG